MSKVTLTDITSDHASVTSLNDNFQSIEEAFNNTVSRDGSAPNNIETNLDMNGKEVINVGAPSNRSSAARWGDILDGISVIDPAPSIQESDKGKVLTVNEAGDGATWEDKDILNVKDLGAVGDGVADDTLVIQNAINTQIAKGGGTVYLPSGVYNISSELLIENTSGLSIVGDGGGWGKFENKDSFGAPTVIKAVDSLNTVFSLVTYQSRERINSSINFKGLGINCNNLAGNGIWIYSLSGSKFEDITIIDSIYNGIHLTCLDNELTNDAADNQGNHFSNITVVTESGSCIHLDGNDGDSATRGANTSLNHFENIHLNIRDNNGFVFGYSDGNTLISLFVFMPSFSSGKGLIFRGDDTDNTRHARHNICYNVQTGRSGILAEQGDFYPSTDNCIIGFNLGNAGVSYPPEIEDGASLSYMSPDMMRYVAGKHICVTGDTDTAMHANADAQKELMNTESIRIWNGSSNHIRIATNSAEWAVRIENSTGNLDFIRISGTGKLNLPWYGQLMLGWKDVSVGDSDSGGAGYRVLRIEN